MRSDPIVPHVRPTTVDRDKTKTRQDTTATISWLKEGVQTPLIAYGTLLLSVAALCGFAQHRCRRGSESEHEWRVTHNGGTAGGVQLIALGLAWPQLGAGAGQMSSGIAWATLAATFAFFVGPLLRALGHPESARPILAFGALVALPGYFGLLWLGLRFL